MAFSAALSTNQQGVTAIAGIDYFGIFTITPDSSCDATGEAVDLTDYFSTIDAVIPCGVSAIAAAGYVPAFFFTPGAAHTSSSLKVVFMNQDGDAGALEPASAVDLSSYTFQVMVYGKMK